jgi:glycosyltransferase involved in cell wall biosynthesis
MTDSMDILVVAGMINRKFFSKVLPLMKLNKVRRIYLVRRRIFRGEKIRCFSPTGVFKRNLLLAELYRVMTIVYILVRFKPEAVIGMGLVLHGVYSNILGAVFGKKKILLLKGRNDLARTYPEKKLLQRILLKVAFLSDFVGTRGTRSKKWLIGKGFSEDKVFIPHNVFDFEEFAPQADIVKTYDMIYVGLLSHYKRVDQLVEVIQKLVFQENLRDIRLAVVGDGELKNQLRTQCAELNVEQNVIFLPTGNASYVCDVLNKSKVFVMTSQGEGLPMAMIEAMSCGLPAVIFDDADIGDMARHGKNGLVIKPRDLDGFAKAVKGLLLDTDLYKALSQGALRIRDEYQERFSAEGVKQVWEQVLTEHPSQRGGLQ